MTNRRREVVGYRPFQVRPLLAEGLLAVARPGGELERVVAGAMFGLADEFGQVADQEAAIAGQRAGERDALAGRPEVGFSGVAADGDHRAIAAAILRKEEGFRETPYWDVNAFRTGYGSDTVTTADGKVRKVEKGMRITRADAERDLARRIPEFENTAAGQVGLEQWNRLPPAARAALLSVTYNYGSLPSSVVRAARAGDAGGVAAAVEGLGSNSDRRKREAGIIRGNVGVPNGPAPEASFDVSGGGFRPTGSNTIFGRAYDQHGAKTYLDMLETEMRSTAGQVYDLYKDDPVAMERAFGALRSELGKDHVFDEIRADYEIGFDRLTEPYMAKARDNLAARLEQQDRAEFIERSTLLSTELQKKLVDFTPGAPGADQAIGDALGAVDRHFDQAVDRGVLAPDDAAKAKVESRRSTAMAFYEKQAEALDAGGVKAMREAMQADFTAGGVDGLDRDGFAALTTKLETLEQKKRDAAARVDRGLRVQGNAIATLVGEGRAVPQAELAKLAMEAGPSGAAAMTETWSKIHAARAIGDMSLVQATKHVAGLKKQYGDNPSAAELRTVAFAQDLLEKKRTEISTDPISYAEKRGIIAPTPMLTEAQDPQELASIVAERSAGAMVASERLQIAPRFLKTGEAKALTDMITADPKRGAGIAAALVFGAGADAPALLAEFSQDGPMIAEAGSILAFGGSARAAEDVILGYGKPDGKEQKGLKREAAQQNFSEIAGGALALAQQDEERVSRAAAAIARRRIAREGVEPDSEEAIAIHAQAVHEAAGAVFDKGVQYGGFVEVRGNSVIVPPQVRTDLFEDTIAALTDADLAALKNPPKPGMTYVPMLGGGRMAKSLAATLQDAVPVYVGGGYAFALGDPASDDAQFIQGQDGTLFVLPYGAMAGTLSARVPGAFR